MFAIVLVMGALLSVSPAAAADAAFQQWLQALWPEAQALSVSRATFDAATRGLDPDLTLPDLAIPGRPEQPQPGQAEFVQTPAAYLKESTFDRLAAQGRKLAADMARRFSESSSGLVCRQTSFSPFGDARLPMAATSCRMTPSACWRPRAMSAAARISSAANSWRR
jgi:hypothetical protein